MSSGSFSIGSADRPGGRCGRLRFEGVRWAGLEGGGRERGGWGAGFNDRFSCDVLDLADSHLEWLTYEELTGVARDVGLLDRGKHGGASRHSGR
jgi:hypothetical protein